MTDWPWLLISSGTGPVIRDKSAAKWLLRHSHKLRGVWDFCRDVFLRWQCFWESVGVFVQMLHSKPFCFRPLHTLSFLCATGCLPVISIYVWGLWASEESQFPFSRWLFLATAGPAPQACWDTGRGACLVSELFYRSRSGIRATCLQRCLCLLRLICALLKNLSKSNWTNSPNLHFLADIIADYSEWYLKG